MSVLMNNKFVSEPMIQNKVIIDPDCTEVPVSNGPLDNWHKQVMTLIRKCYMALNETSFEELLKFYKRSLSEQVRRSSNKTLIKKKILFHLSLIDNLYIESETLSVVHVPNYFDYLIDILAKYANLEMKIIKHLRKRDMHWQFYVMLTASKICKVLSVYLKHSEEHIMHTLSKLRYEKNNVSCKGVINKVYLHFFINPLFQNFTDKAFCCNYLVLDDWKSISNRNQYDSMDKILITKFMQDADYIHRNETLRIIKAMKSKLTSTLFNQIKDKETYFDYIQKNDDIPNMSDAVSVISVEDDNSSTAEHDWDSSHLFRNFAFDMSNNSFKEVLSEDNNQYRCKNIFENDIDSPVNANSNRLPSPICLTDDDSDIEEIVFFKKHKKPITCNGEQEPIIHIDLDEESSNDCIEIEAINNNNNSNLISTIQDDNTNGARGIIMQQGVSSEKDSDFEDMLIEKKFQNMEGKDCADEITNNLKRRGETDTTITATTNAIGVVTNDNNCIRKSGKSTNLKENEEILFSEVESENVEVVQQTRQEYPSPQIQNNSNSVDQTYGTDTALNKNEERTANGNDRFINTVCDTPSVSPHSVHEYMESNGNIKNIDLARNNTDCEPQTELNTSTTFSSICDAPPPEQFDAKSPEMPQHKYLSITNNTITGCIQNDVTCEMQQSTSESDKDILSDMENVANSVADNEHSNTNELFKNINDDNSKDDYESVEYSISPLNHGNANSVNGEMTTYEILVSANKRFETLLKNINQKVASMEDNLSKNNQIINEQPLVVMENNNEQSESIETKTENHVIFDKVDHNCATNSPDNHQIEDLISTSQVNDVVETQEKNDVHAVSLNNVKSVKAKSSSKNGVLLLDDRKIELLADSTQTKESTVKSPVNVIYTLPKTIAKNFHDFEKKYWSSKTFKDAFSGPVTKLNGMPHTNRKLNTAKGQKRVASEEERKKIHQYQDARSIEDLNDICTKRFRCNSKHVLNNYDAFSVAISELLNPLASNSETLKEFSNSPKFLSNCNRVKKNVMDEETQACIKPEEESSTTSVNNFNLMSNNSYFYQCNDMLNNQLPKQVIDNNNVGVVKADDNFNDDNSKEIDILNLNNESKLLKSIECESDSRLPFKKRRIPLPSKEDSKEEKISYPATPMISIAEVEALKNNKLHKAFKTPAERKEMP